MSREMRRDTAAWDLLWDLPEHRAFAAGPSFRHKMRLVQAVIRGFDLQGRVLDVACGTGELLAQLGPEMTERTGADISERALERARRAYPSGRFLRLDIEKETLDETFDVIFCTNALEEMEQDLAALRHMGSMLAPGGTLVLVTPHRKRYWTAKDVLAGNKRRYERSELRDKLAQAGLHVLAMRTWGWPLYRLWYRSMARVDQGAVFQQRALGSVARHLSSIVYRVLFVDDLFRGTPLGSILVAVAKNVIPPTPGLTSVRTRRQALPRVRVEHVPCDFCGAVEPRVLHPEVRDYDLDWPDRYAVVECTRCGLAFLDPRPVAEDIHVYYPPEYNPFNPSQVLGSLAAVKRFLERRKARKVLRLLGPRGRILDAGCSYGGFLDRLRAVGEWELSGIDTDAASISYARERLGLRANVLAFEDVPENTVYDCVVMKYVLDHLASPARAFTKLARIVRPQGYLILQLPNRDSWEARVFGRYWHGWEVPRHSVYFTLLTLRKYAERFGFRVVEVEHEATPNSWVWGLRYLALDHARPLARFCTLGNPFLLLLTAPLGALAALFWASGRVEYVLQKVSGEEPF